MSLGFLVFVFCSEGCKLEVPAFEVEVTEASGGAGGSSSVSSSSSVSGSGGASVSSSASSSSSSGAGGSPPSCAAQPIDDLSCFDGGYTAVNCIACALAAECADESLACKTDVGCMNYNQCLANCNNAGTPWADCEVQCDAGFAGTDAEARYTALFNCVYCGECPMACAAQIASNPAVGVWDLSCVP